MRLSGAITDRTKTALEDSAAPAAFAKLLETSTEDGANDVDPMVTDLIAHRKRSCRRSCRRRNCDCNDTIMASKQDNARSLRREFLAYRLQQDGWASDSLR